MAKNTFIMAKDLFDDEDLELYSDEELGQIMKAIFRYVNHGEKPEFQDKGLYYIFKRFVNFNAENEQKYQSKVEGMMKARESNSKVQTADISDVSDNRKTISENRTEISDNRKKISDSSSDTDTDTVTVTDTVNDIDYERKDTNVSQSVSIQNIFDEHAGCECLTASGKVCGRRATYLINGKRYCNQHSRSILSQTIEGLNGTDHFTPPTIEEVREYCQERCNNVDPEHFVDFYASKGWMVGKNRMKDWKACVRTWEQNQTVRQYDRPVKKTVEEINLENYRRQYEREVARSGQETDIKLFGVSQPGLRAQEG